MKQSLLFADADAELRKFYDMYLTEKGYAVETAADGVECLTKLRRMTPAVLVLDLEINWGGADGVLAWLQDEGHDSKINVITTSKTGNPSIFVADCLPKPFTPDVLLESIGLAFARTEQNTTSSAPEPNAFTR